MNFQNFRFAGVRIEGCERSSERNEKSRYSGSLEFDRSRRRTDLQRRDLARHFLADSHARFLDRQRRFVRLGLPFDLGVDGLQLRAKTCFRLRLMKL